MSISDADWIRAHNALDRVSIERFDDGKRLDLSTRIERLVERLLTTGRTVCDPGRRPAMFEPGDTVESIGGGNPPRMRVLGSHWDPIAKRYVVRVEHPNGADGNYVEDVLRLYARPEREAEDENPVWLSELSKAAGHIGHAIDAFAETQT